VPQPQIFWRRLTGKRALVTGAGTQGEGVGTGKAIAYLFAREGARVCLVDQDETRARATERMIAADGGESMLCAADVTRFEDCERAVAATVERYGGLDILVNNVGIASGGTRLDKLQESDWQRLFDVNLKSAFLMSKAALPHLIACGAGAIVNIASIAGVRAHGSLAYGPSKAAMIALTRELAVIHGRDGIRANVIAPGHIYTPLAAGLLGEQARARRRAIAPLGLEGDAWDIASAALFLASPEARFISGVCLAVDGGVTETGPSKAAEFLQGLT